MVFDRKNIAYLLFLELISFAPLAILLGNIVPPFPIKVHYVVFGLTFLLSLWILAMHSSKKWVLYVFIGYILLQFTLTYWDIRSLIDFFFGPFVLIIMIDLLVNRRLPLALIKKYERRFYYLLWVPITIAVFQFFEWIPITFWNANYINYALIDGVDVPRPNGFLYHGSELSIILCFIALYQYFKEERESFWMMVFLIFVCLATYFKAILACVVLILLYYLLFVNKGTLSRFRLISKTRLFWYGGLLLLIAIGFSLRLFQQVHFYTGNYFPSSLLTGRGFIWNVYVAGIKEYSSWNYLFGSGMGSAFEIFQDQSINGGFTPFKRREDLTAIYDTHNAVLSIFVNAGLVGLVFIGSIFKMIYTQIKTWRPNAQWNKKVYVAIFLLPLFTIGITINYFEMAIIWPCIGFLFYKWFLSTHNQDEGVL